MEDSHALLSKLTRIAVFSFAGVFGVSLYALLGSPFSMSFSSGATTETALAPVSEASSKFTIPTEEIKKHLASAGAALGEAKEFITPVDRSEIVVVLRSTRDELKYLRKALRESSWRADMRPVVFYNEKKKVAFSEMLQRIGDVGSDGFGEASYSYRKIDDVFVGALQVKVVDRNRAYASLVTNETAVLSALLVLIHPDMSTDEAYAHAKRGAEVVLSDGVSAGRLLKDFNGNILLSWRLQNNLFEVKNSQ